MTPTSPNNGETWFFCTIHPAIAMNSRNPCPECLRPENQMARQVRNNPLLANLLGSVSPALEHEIKTRDPREPRPYGFVQARPIV